MKTHEFTDVNFNLDFGNFNPNEIETDETINAVFVVDTSYSVMGYIADLNLAFNDFVRTMQQSHVAAKLFVSIIEFHETVNVVTGFQPISAIQKADFSKKIGGSTALYDAVHAALNNAMNWRQNLENSGVDTKTLLFVITDGDDNASSTPPHVIKSRIEKLCSNERSAFSFSSILFGLGRQADFKKAQQLMGIQNLAQIGTKGSEIRKMIGFISQSLSSMANGQPVPDPDF